MINEITLMSDATVGQAVEAILRTPINGQYRVTIEKITKTRSSLQNNSLHLALRNAAKQLNDAGIGQRDFWQRAKHDFDIPNSESSLKDIFSRVCSILHGEERTHKLTTKELQDAFDVFQLGLSQSCGITVEWPHSEIPIGEQR